MPDERVTDEYLRRPEVTVGYAVVGQHKEPFPTTVSRSARAAMVNGIVSLFGEMVTIEESDAAIEARFTALARPRGHSISLVLIEAVEEVEF